ncbi:MAG: helix-turn-helix domain-containing protein [Oscillospiraceae bacterium]|nr:helix-turn-helix domain-containing protein [Oscillospiraceae bacterium]
MSEDRIAQASRRFLDAVGQNGVQALIRTASEIYDAPVVLTDQLFHIRTVWPQVTGLPALDRCIQSGNLDSAEEWAVLDENLSGIVPFYSTFYSNTGHCADLPRLYGELVWENEVRGHVIVYLNDRPLQEEDREILTKLLSLLLLKLRRNLVGLDTWTATLQAKLEVLLDPTTPFRVRQPAIALLQKEIRGSYGLMVTTIGQRASQRAFADFAVNQIQHQFRNLVVFRYDDAIVTLFGEVRRNSVTNQLHPEQNQLVRWLLRYFEQYDLVSGISDSFTDLSSTYVHYRRALLTAKMVERMKDHSYGLFADFMPMPMIAALLETESADTFLAPQIGEMQAYDRENGTDLFHTLNVYATHLFDKEAAAEALGIHKNTLVYRAGRIAELFDLDLTDRRTQLNLVLSCFIWNLSQGE